MVHRTMQPIFHKNGFRRGNNFTVINWISTNSSLICNIYRNHSTHGISQHLAIIPTLLTRNKFDFISIHNFNPAQLKFQQNEFINSTNRTIFLFNINLSPNKQFQSETNMNRTLRSNSYCFGKGTVVLWIPEYSIQNPFFHHNGSQNA